MRTIVVLLVTIIGVAAYAEEPTKDIVYEMTVNGEPFDITGEKETTIHSTKEIVSGYPCGRRLYHDCQKDSR